MKPQQLTAAEQSNPRRRLRTVKVTSTKKKSACFRHWLRLLWRGSLRRRTFLLKHTILFVLPETAAKVLLPKSPDSVRRNSNFMIVKTHFIQTRQTRSETKTISVRLSAVPTITYSGSVHMKPLIHRVGVSDVSALPLFLTSNAVNSFSELNHCVQAENQNSNWFPN